MVNKIFANNIKSPESLKSRLDGCMAPRTAAMDTFRWGSGGTSLGDGNSKINDQSDRFVRLESAYSNTISDVAMGAASGLSDHSGKRFVRP